MTHGIFDLAIVELQALGRAIRYGTHTIEQLCQKRTTIDANGLAMEPLDRFSRTRRADCWGSVETRKEKK